MTKDYYAVLGVSPTSEDVVIRAAYRALMRRYHPDADPSSEAAQRAQAINAAYAVLGDPEKRVRYDGSLAAQGLIKPDVLHRRSLARRLVPGTAAMIGLAALASAAAFLVISPPLGVLPEGAAPMAGEAPSRRTAAQDANFLPTGKAAPDLCANSTVPGLIKAELIRRAAAVRGVDRERLDRIGAYAVLRLDSPVSRSADSSGAAGCSAGASLDLPPGLVVDGGRTNLNAQLAYGITKGGEGVRLAGLSGIAGLVQSLATIGPVPSEGIEIDLIPPPEVVEARPERSKDIAPRPAEATAANARSVVREAAASSATPSRQPKTCGLGDGWADRAICGSSNLTALDRQHVLLYAQSWARADEGGRAALLGSRERFQTRRDACRTETCLTNAYLARLREISDIMARRAQQ